MSADRSTTRRRCAAVLAAAALTTAACGGGSEGPEEVSKPPTTAATTSTTLARGPEAPLTGLPMDADERERRAVIVKIDNSPEARPQSGIDLADVVYEEKVEGAVVRFLAVFHSRDAELVGPIRSVRSTDASIVAPLGGVFVFSGGIPAFVSQVKAVSDTVTEDDDGGAFKLRTDRKRPYKTYGATAELRAEGGSGDAPPELFPRLDEGASLAAAGVPAAKAVVNFGSRTTAQWDWDAASEVWKRTTNGTPHTVEKGGQLAFTTVIVQPVPYRATKFRDAGGGQVDEAVTVGEGTAIVLAEGRRIDARWSKSSEKALTRYTDATTGQELALPRGTVWVALPPTGAPVTVS